MCHEKNIKKAIISIMMMMRWMMRWCAFRKYSNKIYCTVQVYSTVLRNNMRTQSSRLIVILFIFTGNARWIKIRARDGRHEIKKLQKTTQNHTQQCNSNQEQRKIEIKVKELQTFNIYIYIYIYICIYYTQSNSVTAAQQHQPDQSIYITCSSLLHSTCCFAAIPSLHFYLKQDSSYSVFGNCAIKNICNLINA
jgi:hypothetical protein